MLTQKLEPKSNISLSYVISD